MNTIEIKHEDGNTVTYTEAEVRSYIEKLHQKSKEEDELQEFDYKEYLTIRDIRHNVRDFFSEGEWDNSKTTVNKGDVNLLLADIGCDILATKYSGTFTIIGTFIVEAENADEAESMFVNNVDVSFNDGDYSVDQVETHDIEENN